MIKFGSPTGRDDGEYNVVGFVPSIFVMQNAYSIETISLSLVHLHSSPSLSSLRHQVSMNLISQVNSCLQLQREEAQTVYSMSIIWASHISDTKQIQDEKLHPQSILIFVIAVKGQYRSGVYRFSTAVYIACTMAYF